MNLDTYLSMTIPVQAWLNRFFNEKQELTIFDVGACEGEESIRYAKMFPVAKVYSFEPLLDNYRQAKANLKRFNLDPDLLFNLALGDENGETDFFVSSGHPDGIVSSADWNYGNKSGSMLPPSNIMSENYKWLKFEQGKQVSVCRLDDFCKQNRVSHIDFLHMDVQGAELKVLDGAGDMINEMDLVWLEVSTKSFYREQPLEKEVYKYMKKHGFVFLFKNNEGSYGDHLYASSSFYRQNRLSLDRYTRWKIHLLNFFNPSMIK